MFSKLHASYILCWFIQNEFAPAVIIIIFIILLYLFYTRDPFVNQKVSENGVTVEVTPQM